MSFATQIRRPRFSTAGLIKKLLPVVLRKELYRRMIVGSIPDHDRYTPLYSPWLASDFQDTYKQIRPYTLVSIERLWTIKQTLTQALGIEGDIVEAGVYRGGTALLIRQFMGDPGHRNLLLFDSFEGMRAVSETADRHRPGDFADTSLEAVRSLVGDEPFIDYRKGWIPDTFAGLEGRTFCFAHIDLDLYQSILDCLEFLYPRMPRGAVMVFDDYGFPSCPGARRAVEQFFAGRPEEPLALMTGQALVFKL